MQLKQLITGGALAATVLTIGSAQAEKNPLDGVVFCKAKVYLSDNPETQISITLPFTGDMDFTYWNLGAVPAGGVADSWHSKDGPGKFEVHNNGEMGVYVYLTSSSQRYYAHWIAQDNGAVSEVLNNAAAFENTEDIFPTPSLQHWRHSECGQYYCLAFTRDLKGKIPTWHMLDMWNDKDNTYENTDSARYWFSGDEWNKWERTPMYVGAYMGFLDAGEYMPFDVKFWAPRVSPATAVFEHKACFTFMVEAAPFPLWEHDADVQ